MILLGNKNYSINGVVQMANVNVVPQMADLMVNLITISNFAARF